jgi:hypothetical protein
MENERWILDQYEKRRRLSVYWMNYAEDLRRSALAVRESSTCSGSQSVHLLEGLALEVLLKGCVVRRDGHDENVIKRKHDLLKNSNTAGLVLGPAMTDYLRALSLYITWLGKYPIGLSREATENAYVDLNKLWKHEPLAKGSRFRVSSPDPDRSLSKENFDMAWAIIHAHYHSFEDPHRYV